MKYSPIYLNLYTTPMPTSTVDIRPMVEAAIATALAPTPTPTPDVQSMVEAAVHATLAAAAPPEQTYTPKPTPTQWPTVVPPTPTSIPTPVPTIPLAPTPRPTRIYFTVQPPRVTIVPSTPTPVPNRLQEVRCGPPCYEQSVPIFPPVDWISGPTITQTSVIELVAVLDDDVDMGALGTEDGGHLVVTDIDNILYGSIEAPTTPGWYWVTEPGLWVAEQFDYVSNTLRVRAQIDPAGANHPRLRLCLWSGKSEGDVEDERSLLAAYWCNNPEQFR